MLGWGEDWWTLLQATIANTETTRIVISDSELFILLATDPPQYDSSYLRGKHRFTLWNLRIGVRRAEFHRASTDISKMLTHLTELSIFFNDL